MKYLLLVEWRDDVKHDLHQKYQFFDDYATVMRRANHYENEARERNVYVTEIRVIEVANILYT